MTDLNLFNKLVSLPEHLRKEVSDFIESLQTRNKKPKPKRKRKLGLAKGLIKMSDDFDEPLEDFNAYLE